MLLFGAADYAADLGQQVDTFQPDFARATLVNAAASAGIVAIGSPFIAIDDPDALVTECRASRALDYWGKATISPTQLDAIGEVFVPSATEIALARRILDAAPDGVCVLDGKMIDVAMVRWARRFA